MRNGCADDRILLPILLLLLLLHLLLYGYVNKKGREWNGTRINDPCNLLCGLVVALCRIFHRRTLRHAGESTWKRWNTHAIAVRTGRDQRFQAKINELFHNTTTPVSAIETYDNARLAEQQVL
jgi:hypothetical protein